ncbi:hypothetical protein C1C97_003845 [Kocuria tytonis]|uniref:Uncharacterized protein n=1 Tax=Kocuria tytonis TaxID=2054280 RepID=A0A495AAR2_9MICC|nr:hypothetical protein C1C97_003845 [Kocuria tytonis]
MERRTARRSWRPGRRTVGLAAAVATCLCVAVLTAAVWNVGRHAQQEQRAAARPAATWSAGPQSMVDTTSDADIRSLRAQGWAVPGLAAQGYTVADVQQLRTGGQPAVALTLHGERGTVEIVEQRGHINPDNPLDGVSGLPVSAEGMHESVISGSHLWVDRHEPWRAVMARPDAVYTVTSDAPAATMARTVSGIVAEDRARVSLPTQQDEGFGATVADGLRKIFG